MRHEAWSEIPDETWTNWKWQLRKRLNSLEELDALIDLTDSEKAALSQNSLFRVDITPYFLSLIDRNNPDCPVRRQVIPRIEEIGAFDGMEEDSLAEDQYSPVNGIVHRYPDRVLMLITTQCASYCRYCTRSRLVGDSSKNYGSAAIDAQIDYIRRNPQIRDVLLSGGDPLIMPLRRLEYILSSLRDIPHLEIIRIGSRTPIFNPFVITQELCDLLERYHPLWINIHVNHSNEITPELAEACSKLAKAGIPLGNQAVLLKDVNDTLECQKKLCTDLVKMRVRPYYLYQCDLVKGAGHFITPFNRGIEIIEGLRGHISGYAVPTFVVDAPHGGGKIPIAPNYIISQGVNKVVLRNFEGFITVYNDSGKVAPPKEVNGAHQADSTILSLIQGGNKFLKPEKFRSSRIQEEKEPALQKDKVIQ